MGNSMNHIAYTEAAGRAELERLAAEESTDAKIELAALRIEEAQDVERNLAFLNEQAEAGSTRALMRLCFIYAADVTRTEADGSETVLLAADPEKSDGYARKAAGLGSAWGMMTLGIRAWLRTLGEGDDCTATADDFRDAEKWLTAAAEAARMLGSDLQGGAAEIVMEKLAAVYGNASPRNPVRSEEKAQAWRERAEAAAGHPAPEYVHMVFGGPDSPPPDWWHPPRNAEEERQQKVRLFREKQLRRQRHPRRATGLRDYPEERQDDAH